MDGIVGSLLGWYGNALLVCKESAYDEDCRLPHRNSGCQGLSCIVVIAWSSLCVTGRSPGLEMVARRPGRD